jgi:hypothetical protein
MKAAEAAEACTRNPGQLERISRRATRFSLLATRYSLLTIRASLNHRVGERNHRARHRQAERLRGLQVDDELEPGRLRDRQVGGFLALEDAARIGADLAILGGDAASVGTALVCSACKRRRPIAVFA